MHVVCNGLEQYNEPGAFSQPFRLFAKELSLHAINKKFTLEMKKIFAIMAAAILGACAQDEPTPEQETDTNAPTTFSWLLEEDAAVFSDAMSAYYDEEGKCRLIAEHGKLIQHVETDTVTMEEFHSPIYLFYANVGGCRLTAAFYPEQGKHTTFVISMALGDEGVKGIRIIEKNPFNWPRESEHGTSSNEPN
jgi:hypothetical protein